MFSRSNKKEIKIETVVGLGTTVEGNFKTAEGLRVDGKIRGSIQADTIIVGAQGVVSGDVVGTTVTISGKVEGNVSASTTVELLASGVILGDIHTNKLVISDGARFEGNCKMAKSNGQIIELNPEALQDKNMKVFQNKQKAPAAS